MTQILDKEAARKVALDFRQRIAAFERRFNDGDFSNASFMLCIKARPASAGRDAIFCNCVLGRWGTDGKPDEKAGYSFRVIGSLPDTLEGVKLFTADKIDAAVSEAKKQTFAGWEVQAVFSRHQTLEWYERIAAMESALPMLDSQADFPA